jgi:hypothetical protein
LESTVQENFIEYKKDLAIADETNNVRQASIGQR